MPYSVVSSKNGKTFYLHSRKQKLRGGHEVTLFFFSPQIQEGALEHLPEGYQVSENTRTGLPILKKIKA
ncbi:MAG: hypothetical protein RML49_04970 [Verrucomicrobiae bacterium]|nr:hypothetical protein [Verrucomicrobiae bacterium]